jgi:hypothetical protein
LNQHSLKNEVYLKLEEVSGKLALDEEEIKFIAEYLNYLKRKIRLFD